MAEFAYGKTEEAIRLADDDPASLFAHRLFDGRRLTQHATESGRVQLDGVFGTASAGRAPRLRCGRGTKPRPRRGARR